jgi:riboflavin synthase
MFTGIIEGTARVKSVSKIKNGADTLLRIQLGKLGRGLKVGDSVSVSGACLTVSKLSKGDADFQMVAETVRRTSLGSLKPNDKVNIERSLKMGERLEGHFVLGHVDGTGVIEDIIEKPTETTIWIKLDETTARSVVPKGSIAVDGVSLTLVETKGNRVSISLIPHTLKMTTLGLRSKGDRVNIETDILGKYVTKNLH